MRIKNNLYINKQHAVGQIVYKIQNEGHKKIPTSWVVENKKKTKVYREKNPSHCCAKWHMCTSDIKHVSSPFAVNASLAE